MSHGPGIHLRVQSGIGVADLGIVPAEAVEFPNIELEAGLNV